MRNTDLGQPIEHPQGGLKGIVIQNRIVNETTPIWARRVKIIGCAATGSLGVLLLDALIVRPGVAYELEDKIVLYGVATHNMMARFTLDSWVRPLEYLILLAANQIYFPLWLGASLFCAVGATILSARSCEVLFERQLPKAGWWILGIANPLLFLLVTSPSSVAQTLCNLLFAAVILLFISDFHSLGKQQPSGWRADNTVAFLNLTAAVLFFTKENAVAAAVVVPAITALIRFKTGRLSRIFLFSLLLPIGAAGIWILIKLQLPLSRYMTTEGHYGLALNPITWGKNFIITLAFPVTPLPSSFIAFDVLRTLWIAVALGSVAGFIGLLLFESLRQPKIVLPLSVIGACLSPMILIHSSELYSTMIAPFAVSIVILFSGVSKIRWPSLAYGVLLYTASLGNGIVYTLGSNFQFFGLERKPYSIYSENRKQDPTCPIGATTHVAWDETASSGQSDMPGVKGRIICVR
jgi:hypothetical protein